MARARPEKHNGEPLFTINAELPAADQPGAAEALAELRQLLASAGAPDELLEILDGPGTPAEILQELTDSGLLPSAEDSLGGLVSYFEPLLEDGTDPLQAELAGSQFLGMMRQGGAAAEDLPELLRMLAEQAEEYGGPVALAMLRVLAAVAPQEPQAALTAAAERLVATGLTDRPWVAGLGAPIPGRCFGYRDVLGAQETVAITFRYRRERHAFCVLIDHDLGGGVKDCWPTDRVDEVRTEYEALADPGLMEFREYQPAEAQAILAIALDQPPCPEQPDQVEDVRDYLELLRQRVARLADALPAPAPREPRDGDRTATVHRLKIGLRGAKPPIWRRLEVPSRFTLDDLHGTIQRAFDWEGYHLWVFETAKGRYGIVDPELEHRSAAAVRLDQVAPGDGDRIRYTYDFGDNWEHEILVEDVLAAEPGVAYPRCLAGRRATPPEDCGGIWGYQYLLEVLDDPQHPEHQERLEWLGLASADELDPAAFDHAELNRALPAKVLVRS